MIDLRPDVEPWEEVQPLWEVEVQPSSLHLVEGRAEQTDVVQLAVPEAAPIADGQAERRAKEHTGCLGSMIAAVEPRNSQLEVVVKLQEAEREVHPEVGSRAAEPLGWEHICWREAERLGEHCMGRWMVELAAAAKGRRRLLVGVERTG